MNSETAYLILCINEQRYSGRMQGSGYNHYKREIPFHCFSKDCRPVSAGLETNAVVPQQERPMEGETQARCSGKEIDELYDLYKVCQDKATNVTGK